MNVILAKSAGFCFGVKRAVNMVYEEIEKANGRIYTYGPIIHNDEVVKDFINGEVGRYVIEDETTEYEEKEELVELSNMDTSYFAEVVRGVHKEKEQLEKSLAHYLRDGWSFDRFDGTLRALLLCAAYELVHTTDIDATVIIKEYVDLAYAFFDKSEPKMVNALLDQISKAVR